MEYATHESRPVTPVIQRKDREGTKNAKGNIKVVMGDIPNESDWLIDTTLAHILHKGGQKSGI